MPGVPANPSAGAVLAPEGQVVLVPYVGSMLRPETVAALEASLPAGWLVNWQKIDRGDHYAYWRLVAESWRLPGPTFIVEHDIEVHEDVLPQLAACAEGWCTFPYLQQPGLNFTCTQALGCTRFSAPLQRAVPFPPATRWESLDGAIANALLGAGMAAHVHQPPVTHHRL